MLRKSKNNNSAFLPLKYSGNVNYLMCRNFQIFGGAEFREDFEQTKVLVVELSSNGLEGSNDELWDHFQKCTFSIKDRPFVQKTENGLQLIASE